MPLTLNVENSAVRRRPFRPDDSNGRSAVLPAHRHAQKTIDCDVLYGPPSIRGRPHAQVLPSKGGRPMPIVERRAGERNRINATTELVILEVDTQHVRLAIEFVEVK